MILYRALNEFDIAANPLENGIASKNLIYELTKRKVKKGKLSFTGDKNVSDDEYVRRYLEKYYSKLEAKFLKNSQKSRENVGDFVDLVAEAEKMSDEELYDLITKNSNHLPVGSIVLVYNYLTTIQRHIIHGSRNDTNWISTSRSLDSILKFYDQQHIHKVAVINSDTNGFCESDCTLSIDLSNYEAIDKINSLIFNKIDFSDTRVELIAKLSNLFPDLVLYFKKYKLKSASINSRAFVYSNASNEVCLYRYIPTWKVSAVLEALQIDLYKNGRFNEDFLLDGGLNKKKELKKLKEKLKVLLNDEADSKLMYYFYKLYYENINLTDLDTDDSMMDIEHCKEKILDLSLKIPSPIIKR